MKLSRLLLGFIFFLSAAGCETFDSINNVHSSERRDKIISFHRDAYIRPLLAVGLDTQGYVAVDEVKNVPLSLATAQGEVIVSRDVGPAPMIDLRFAKAGIETRITDQFGLNLYADTAFLWGSILSGSIESNDHTAPPNDVHSESGASSPGYTAGYSPSIIPGFNAELFYFLKEKGPTYLMLGGRYREFDLNVVQGGWYWGEGSGAGDGKEFDIHHRTAVADIFEKSVYIGIGALKPCETESKSDPSGIMVNVMLKIGLAFNDIDVKDKWKDTLRIDRDYPAVFGGLDFSFNF